MGSRSKVELAPALEVDVVIEAASRVGVNYAVSRTWLDIEETKQEAIVIGLELMHKAFIRTEGIRNREAWLSYWIRNRLHDWQRKQRFRYQGKREQSKQDVSVSLVEYLPEYSGSAYEMGYWFIEEISTYKERMAEMAIKVQKPLTDRQLTDRELEVLQLLADGNIRKEIASTLYISDETVKTYMKRIHDKLRAKNTPHAVAIGVRQGLVI